MRKSRFSDEQIVAILREADRTSVAEAAKKHKVSDRCYRRDACESGGINSCVHRERGKEYSPGRSRRSEGGREVGPHRVEGNQDRRTETRLADRQ
jgi:hypothetical protein